MLNGILYTCVRGCVVSGKRHWPAVSGTTYTRRTMPEFPVMPAVTPSCLIWTVPTHSLLMPRHAYRALALAGFLASGRPRWNPIWRELVALPPSGERIAYYTIPRRTKSITGPLRTLLMRYFLSTLTDSTIPPVHWGHQDGIAGNLFYTIPRTRLRHHLTFSFLLVTWIRWSAAHMNWNDITYMISLAEL